VTCSNGIGGIHTRTPDFVCQARLANNMCDQFEVHRFGGRWHITLRRRGVDCLLPA
jgi:hypothetical protein